MYKLIVNGNVFAQLKDIKRLKRLATETKGRWHNATVTIESLNGYVLYSF